MVEWMCNVTLKDRKFSEELWRYGLRWSGMFIEWTTIGIDSSNWHKKRENS